MATPDEITAKAALKQSLAQILRMWWFAQADHHKSTVDLFVREAVPMVLAYEQVMAETTANYLRQQYEAAGLPYTARLDTARVTGAVIRGVEPAQVYARPFVDTWAALGDELGLDEALERGATRLDQLSDTDLELVHDWTVRDIVGQTRVVGYRRVPRASACALCHIASTQRYHRGDLKGIHPGCHCTVRIIAGDEDVDQVLDGDLLEKVHAAIADKYGTSASDARKIDYRKVMLTREHGEYGPTLTWARDSFTGPSGIG